MISRMMKNWALILCLFDQNMPIHNGYTLKMEINGQTIDDGVRHSCRFLSKSVCFEKFAYNPLTASKVKLKMICVKCSVAQFVRVSDTIYPFF